MMKAIRMLKRQQNESIKEYAQRLKEYVRVSKSHESMAEVAFEIYLAKHYANLSARAKAAIECLYALTKELEKLDPGLNEIEVEYSGYGDQGQIESISINTETEECVWKGEDVIVRGLIDELAWDIAYGSHPGFEINEGGQGVVRMRRVYCSDDAMNNEIGWTLSLHHEDNVIEVKTSDLTF